MPPKQIPALTAVETAQILTKARVLVETGFFDERYYAAHYAVPPGQDLFEHFFLRGYKDGNRPNPVFDPLWYMSAYPAVAASGLNPLLDYALFGEKAGRNPSPLFDAQWYREHYKLGELASPMLHYLRSRPAPFNPIPEFDAHYYLAAYPDVVAAKTDPFEHYCTIGFREGRNPSADFNGKAYAERFLKGQKNVNPLAHYRASKNWGQFRSSLAGEERTPFASVKKFSRPGKRFAEFAPLPAKAERRAKVLAFYLTQFHAIPENDRWWGKGFTEWTNVARGQPRFHDHYQPRIPRDLGYYSLDDVNVMRRQATMARDAGLSGFVFYYYRFDGKRLLEKPLENFLAARDIDMPFALMWANENWTRRWDGEDQDVLIAQNYGPADDEGVCADFARHFHDPRYIRLGGRPLLMIYRPGLLDHPAATLANWRRIFREKFRENPILVMAQCFDDHDPRLYGLDGAVEFPPHKLAQNMPNINAAVEMFDPGFNGDILDYDAIVAASLDEPAPDFPLIKTAVPGWDNDARRQGAGLTIHDSTPAKYEAWLGELVERAGREAFFGEAVVCVNAWNEWAEGAYLEPDQHFGAAFLNATARAVAGTTKKGQGLLLIGHDAHPHGAQMLLLHIGASMKALFGVDIAFILLGPGPLTENYRAIAPVETVLDPRRLPALITAKKAQGFGAAIVNTVAAGEAAPILKRAGLQTTLLVHEMPELVKEKALEEAARRGIENADLVVFPADCVREALLDALSLRPDSRMRVRPQGSYKRLARRPENAARLRAHMGVSADAPLALGVGYADMRKGFDLFLGAWTEFRAQKLKVHFCWIGNVDPIMAKQLAAPIEAAKRTGTFHLPGFIADPDDYYAAADVLVLSSREDPFPTVALEALSLGVPIAAFGGSGGVPEFLTRENLGVVAPMGDPQGLALAIEQACALAAGPDFVGRAQEIIETKFAFDAYARDLFALAMPRTTKVSVVVPNYNYAHCLAERLHSIFDQDHPIWEIIVLDDASTDDSFDVIHDVAEARDRDLTLIVNETNSGSPFKQWARGAETATGDFIWIAEADDLAEPTLLSRLVEAMKIHPDIAMAFCDSRSIDADGAPLAASYKSYYATVEPDALAADGTFAGRDFIARYLSVKNLILNVSAVLWRRDALVNALKSCEDEISQFKVAGDWRLYAECLVAPGARIAYVAEPLNSHRRHEQSVTHALDARQHVDEIAAMQSLTAEICALSEAGRGRQAAYLGEIAEQLLGPDGSASTARPVRA